MFTGDPCKCPPAARDPEMQATFPLFQGPDLNEKHEIELVKALYVTEVFIRFSKLMYTNYQSMVNFTIVVGVGKDCSEASYHPGTTQSGHSQVKLLSGVNFDPSYCRLASSWNFMTCESNAQVD